MKRFYVEQINKILEDYHFNVENNAQGRESHYGILSSGIQHLYGVAFCAYDDETLNELEPIINAVMEGEVPRSIFQEVAA